ncbi:Oidioi.mRNA.OKI2018_I69.chr2.g8222.t1.cds [Oikopleura dioica]|uniref:Oidioi.mRNA.OKI2018_I69.chr2.g8222.t1.cds n=1 Tax=Oikopleura dioica TaxID=34765 RepID=A0ABN7TE97_OIKDI|nr:Oidioi.mRNA.OKI2018_I69.chr2.g8222.t1.cds [Oikopleura dioica]
MDDSSIVSSPKIRDDEALRPRSMSDPGPGPLCTSERFFELIKSSKNSHVETLVRLDPALLTSRVKGKLTPMMEACFKGNLGLVRFFLDRGCDANEKYGDDQYTPLMLAALGGHAEIMVSLLEAGADPHEKNRIGKTAAMLCGFVGMKESHRILNCWIKDSQFIDKLVLKENWTNDLKRRLRRLICHPNCLPVSIMQRIQGLSDNVLRKLIPVLLEQIPREAELPICLRFQIISETLRQFLALGTTARRFQKLMLNHPKAYDDLITRCCLALSNRNEIAALKMAVSGEYTTLNAAIRQVIGDTSDITRLCSVCFEPSKYRCGKCTHRTAFAIYCSRYCQKLHWKLHRPLCHKFKM